MPLEENGTDYDEIEAGQMPPSSVEFLGEERRLVEMGWEPAPLISEDDAPLQPDPTGRERAWLQALHEFPDDTRARRLLFLECAERTLTDARRKDLQRRIKDSAGSAGHAGFGFGDAVESDLSECR